MWKTFWLSALELAAPTRCAACDAQVSLEALSQGFCDACELLIETYPSTALEDAAAFVYGGPMREAIHRMKFRGRSEIAALLGKRMADVALRFAGEVDAVVPVPLHGQRLRERGYNQAALLSRWVARDLGLPWMVRALSRIRPTIPQAEMSGEARLHNMKAAFRAEPGLPERVLLVDDVRTTGATLVACCDALRQAGVVRIHTLALARTLV